MGQILGMCHGAFSSFVRGLVWVRSCPRNGSCESCSNVQSLAVGSDKRDRVLVCRVSRRKLGYDNRYGNRPVPIYQTSDSCFHLAKLAIPSTIGGR